MAEVVNLKPAASSLSHYNFNPLTVASLDFGEAPSLRNIECEKRDEWQSISVKGFLRMAPMDFPAYGRAMLKTASFFVPYYQLIKSIDSFRQNQQSYKGSVNVMPYISAHDINNIFAYTNHQLATIQSGPTANILALEQDPDKFDFTAISNGGDDNTLWATYKLTYKGKRYYKLLKSLGYEFRGYGTNTVFSINADTGNLTPNALYLLAYLKIYCDYFVNIHEYNNNRIVDFLDKIHSGATTINYDGTSWMVNGRITYDALWYILDNILIPHESSMYTDAWNSLNSPTGVVDGASVSPDGPISFVLPSNVSGATSPTVTGTVLRNQSDGTFLTQRRDQSGNVNYVLESLTQLGINSLHSLFEFVRRNNLMGSEAAKLAFARFGIKGDDYNSYFCRKLYEGSTPIDFSAVMSNSNTIVGDAGSPLGAYAGVGLGSLDFSFNYKCSDYGVIMTLCWLQILPLWLHGFDPAVLRKHPFDWYTPEFDGKASRAIPFGEMSMSFRPSRSNYQFLDTTVWGFTDLYKEYRQMRDVVLGDFVFGHAKNFVFARDLSKRRIDNPFRMYPQTRQVQYYDRFGQATDLTNPFQYTTANGDRFYLQLTFDISANRPILGDADSLDLNGSGDVPMNISGNPNA